MPGNYGGTRETSNNNWLIRTCHREKVVINRRVLEYLIDIGSQVSVISEGMVRSSDLRVIPVYPTINLKTANGTKLDYMGQVITDIML